MADTGLCAICRAVLDEPYRSYPKAVCPECDARALNSEGRPARHITEIVPPEKAADYVFADDGDNPVFIDGIRCRRRYKFGGWVTMRDE
ncbi:MAG TPA: hypothetical protein PK544_14995 [Spirochaetota bacterium]|nr:hypothetical protein [Spirochaetota bacterium]HPJ38727.1 hypothetical protein [Spirochaetota bacterium]HPQ52147.1 hypothetical protein [Spirochaetota bacterium]